MANILKQKSSAVAKKALQSIHFQHTFNTVSLAVLTFKVIKVNDFHFIRKGVCQFLLVITSAKEVMFLPVFVSLFVCESTR